MKKIMFFCLICAATHAQAQAQDPLMQSIRSFRSRKMNRNPADTLPRKWHPGALFSFNLSQGALSNWAAGGDDFALTVNTHINAHAFYKCNRHSWDNLADVNLGYVKTTSLGARKNDDRIDLLSKYGYALKPKLNLTGLFNFRSQFFKGYNYTADSNNKINSTRSSAFFAPAYILTGAGLDYHNVPELSFFVSPFTSRWTIVKDDSLSAQGAYGVPKNKKSANALGAYISINYSTSLNNTVSYTGRLDLFSDYKHHPENVDLYSTNIFSAKLSKVFSATWNVDLIYDDDVRIFGPNHNSPRLQIKSLIGFGLLVKL